MPLPLEKNVVLIGMPGAGKSTIGVLLAKQSSRAFLDTDLLIQLKQGRSLQELVDDKGYLALRAMEEQVLIKLRCSQTVIATGGSAAYSDRSMQHLRRLGVIVFLDVPFGVIQERVRNFGTRGIARRADQSFHDLFNERRPLYQKYADITIACTSKHHEELCGTIRNELECLDEIPRHD